MCRCGASATTKLCEEHVTSLARSCTCCRRGLAAVGALPTGEAERVQRQVEKKNSALTRTVPMVEIEDLPPSMKPHVVGALRTWVWLFRHLENAVDYYNRAHMPHP
jgi:hypothetical protein